MEEVKNVSENEICCHFRYGGYYFYLILLLLFIGFLIYCLIALYENSLAWYSILAFALGFICLFIYNILTCFNKKVILTNETITNYDVWGRKKEYDLTEVTQVVFKSYHRKGSSKTTLIIKVNNSKKGFVVGGCNFSKFESKLAGLLGLKGYSRGFNKTFNL